MVVLLFLQSSVITEPAGMTIPVFTTTGLTVSRVTGTDPVLLITIRDGATFTGAVKTALDVVVTEARTQAITRNLKNIIHWSMQHRQHLFQLLKYQREQVRIVFRLLELTYQWCRRCDLSLLGWWYQYLQLLLNLMQQWCCLQRNLKQQHDEN